MSNRSSTKSKGTESKGLVAQPQAPGARNVRARSPSSSSSRVRTTQEQRRAMIIGGVISGSLMVVAVMATEFALSTHSSGSSQTATTPSNEIRSATIIAESLDDNCRQRIFDNQTGAMADTRRPCKDPAVFDVNGLPVPAGTIHRLDGISKSFLNR
jgi:hypothetical protein